MTASRVPYILIRSLGAFAGVTMLIMGYVYGVSEWRMRRIYDAPLTSLHPQAAVDEAEGKRMAKIIGCWAGCHGPEGEGGVEFIKGIHRNTAPTLSQVLPLYSDEALVRLIRYGVKRDGRSAIGMISYTFWPLGDQDLTNIIAYLRAQRVRPPVPRKHELEFRGRVALTTGAWKVSAEQVDRSIPRWGELPRNTAFERGRYLASITCSECHGLDFRGNELEGGPSLAILALYQPDQFRHLMRTGKPIDGRNIDEYMGWLAKVDLTDRDIEDLYTFLRAYHGLGTAPTSAFSGSALGSQ
ncbi:MAG: c-type cytochrome [Gemmatimonadaceae bacterium]|nr:c-type cytochrome [Gemmatimonadaceae bacterium]